MIDATIEWTLLIKLPLLLKSEQFCASTVICRTFVFMLLDMCLQYHMLTVACLGLQVVLRVTREFSIRLYNLSKNNALPCVRAGKISQLCGDGALLFQSLKSE